MQLSRTTEYSIRALIYLERNPGIRKLEEVANNMHIPEGYLAKVLRMLKQEKIVETHQGANGGYQLTEMAKKLSLYDIMEITEKTLKINHCLEHGKCALTGDDGICATGAKKIYCELQEIFESRMKSVMLKDLAPAVRK